MEPWRALGLRSRRRAAIYRLAREVSSRKTDGLISAHCLGFLFSSLGTVRSIVTKWGKLRFIKKYSKRSSSSFLKELVRGAIRWHHSNPTLAYRFTARPTNPGVRLSCTAIYMAIVCTSFQADWALFSDWAARSGFKLARYSKQYISWRCKGY